MKRSEIAFSASLVPIDYLMVILAGIASYYIRFWEPVQRIRPIIFNLHFEPFLAILWLMALIWLFSFWLAGLYSMQGTRRTIDEISHIILGCSTAVMILMFVFFFSRNLFDSRFIILAGWVFSIIFIIIGRGLIRFFQHFLYKFNIGVHRIVVLGNGQIAKEATEIFKSNVMSGYKVVDQFADFNDNTENELTTMISHDKFDEILVASPDFKAEQSDKLNDFSYVNHITLKYIADIFDFPISNFEINNISGLPIVEVKKTRLDGWGKINKRIFDIIISTFLIILLSPVFLIIALAIKFDSKGPIFFKYKRIGQFGRPFIYFKFR
ncbi:MAG: sugar transferase, partial [Patescibacteria group bacterium]